MGACTTRIEGWLTDDRGFCYNQLTQATYDAAGNEINDGFHNYRYDADGNVTQVDGGSSASTDNYDALNQRVAMQRSSGANEFVFDQYGKRVSVWVAPSQTLQSTLVYWDGKPLLIRANGTTHFEHGDWVGTVRMRTGPTGAVGSGFASLPFGDGYAATGDQEYAWGHFAGTEYDYESNTSHAQFRQYNSTQGRWMSPDLYDGSYDQTNPQSFNRFSYVMNSPVSSIDPSGLQSGEPPSGGGSCGDACEVVTLGLVAAGEAIAEFFDGPSFQGSLQPRPNIPNIMSTYYNANGIYTIQTGPNFFFTGGGGSLTSSAVGGTIGAGALLGSALAPSNQKPNFSCPAGTTPTNQQMLVTGYDNYFESTGKNPGDPGFGLTTNGSVAGPGTIAAPRNFPFGTRLYIPGYGPGVVQDRGGAIKNAHIDAWFSTVQQARKWGAQHLTVTICR